MLYLWTFYGQCPLLLRYSGNPVDGHLAPIQREIQQASDKFLNSDICSTPDSELNSLTNKFQCSGKAYSGQVPPLTRLRSVLWYWRGSFRLYWKLLNCLKCCEIRCSIHARLISFHINTTKFSNSRRQKMACCRFKRNCHYHVTHNKTLRYVLREFKWHRINGDQQLQMQTLLYVPMQLNI